VKLRWPVALVLLALGAVASLVGDHSHVATGTTEYLSSAVPFVWSSPVWFPTLVALATVAIAELRLRLPDLRSAVTARHGLAGVAAVIGIYVTTALVHTAPAVPANVLIYALAAITWCALGDRWGALCGALVAVIGPAVEAAVAAGAWPATPRTPTRCSVWPHGCPPCTSPTGSLSPSLPRSGCGRDT
jgi:hypothetical protein